MLDEHLEFALGGLVHERVAQGRTALVRRALEVERHQGDEAQLGVNLHDRFVERLDDALSGTDDCCGPTSCCDADAGVVDQAFGAVLYDEAITALFGDTQRNRVNFENLFITPMIPNAYKEALGQPIIQGEGNPAPAYAHTPPKPSSKKHGS